LLARVARSTNAQLSSTKFTMEFDNTRPKRILGLINHNLSLDAQYYVEVSNNSAFTQIVYDSGVLYAWPPRSGTRAQRFWEADEWGDSQTVVSDSDRAIYNPSIIVVLPTKQIGPLYWRVTIEDTGNPDGYVQFGRLFLAGEWQPRFNPTLGSTRISYEDPSVIETAIGGVEYYDRRPKHRVLQFNLDWMDTREGFTRAFDLQKLVGVTKEVLVIYDADDDQTILRHSFLGRLRQLNPIENPYATVTRTAFEVKELR
jgi:hypothetical protein